jgi:dimethylhistidine N-methyltransferase
MHEAVRGEEKMTDEKKKATMPVSREPVALQPGRRFLVEATDRASILSDLAGAVREGLTSDPKVLPPWIFYDEEGSRIFAEIMELSEYYLTGTERLLLKETAPRITRFFEGPIDLVELGSGTASKTRILIEAFLERHGTVRYIPIDISRSAVTEASRSLLRDYKDLEIHALACDFSSGLERLSEFRSRQKLVLWLGSTIGNLERRDAVALLKNVSEVLGRQDRFLVGIDMQKDEWILHRAYNDHRGVTARFNKNALARINRELGGEFDLDSFAHRATYEKPAGAIRLFLVSRKDQVVRIRDLDLIVRFEKGEALHTENSYKYSFAEIEALASASDFSIERQWRDPLGWFTVNLFAPDQ